MVKEPKGCASKGSLQKVFFFMYWWKHLQQIGRGGFLLSVVLLDASHTKGQFEWVCLLTFGLYRFFQNGALACLAWSKLYVIIFFLVLSIFSDFGNSPRMHICGHIGSFSDTIFDNISSTSFQRFMILGHSHRQWNSLSFSTLHFTLTTMRFGSEMNLLLVFWKCKQISTSYWKSSVEFLTTPLDRIGQVRLNLLPSWRRLVSSVQSTWSRWGSGLMMCCDCTMQSDKFKFFAINDMIT